MNIVKHGVPENIGVQYERLVELGMGPLVVKYCRATYELQYHFVQGSLPTSINVVCCAAERLWCHDDKEKLPIDRDAYIKYVLKRCDECSIEFIDMPSNSILTPVAFCHGDMTLDNAVMHPDRGIVFIDPGDPRGLPCRELDEAKLMQCADGWCDRDIQPALPFRPRRIHYWLLWSHYVRMLRHQAGHRLTFAHKRIGDLRCILQ